MTPPSSTLEHATVYERYRATSSSPTDTQTLEKYQFILPYSVLLETTETHHQKTFFSFISFFKMYKPFEKNSTKNPHTFHPDMPNVNLFTTLINRHSSITQIRKLT